MTPPKLRATAAYNQIGMQTRVVQPSQFDLALMMFDVTLESLTRAKGAIQARDVNDKVRLLGKAIRIIEEGLRTSLDMQNGGELAENLNALYDYCVIRLTAANATNNVELIDEVIGLLKPVADAWKSIDPRNPGTDAPESQQTESKVGGVVSGTKAGQQLSSFAALGGMGLSMGRVPGGNMTFAGA
jgi:flagellar secretion chaperone FliS